MELIVPPSSTHRGVRLATDLGRHGGRIALSTPTGELTYRELDERVTRAAARLGPVPRLVSVAMTNDVEPIVWYLAALRGGHPVLLVDGDDRRHRAALHARYDPDVVVGAVAGAAGGLEVVERRPGTSHELHPDLSLLLTTSGTTGSPRVVRLSAANVQANAESIVDALGISDTDRAATTLPLHYSYGLSVLNSHLDVGAALLVTDQSVIDPCFWERFSAEGATSLAGVPHSFDLLDRVDFPSMSLPALRRLTQAGGRLPPEQVRRYADLGRRDGWDLFVMYGQTEATARMAYLPPVLAREHPEAIGIPIPGGAFDLEPVDGFEDGTGELVYRGPNVMLGYAEGPADLAEGRTVEALRTGDLARLGDQGLYEIVGRRSRFVKPFGLRVDLDHVEAVLADIGIPSVCTGDDDELVVAIEAGHDASEVRAVLGERLGLPDHRLRVLVLAELPRLASGKPDRMAVDAHARAERAERAVGGAAPADDDVRALFATVLHRDDVGDDDTFVSLGGDSLSYVEMSIRLEGALGDLPDGWHTMPVRSLERAGAPPRRRTALVETNVVLRAAAIITVVGTHAGLLDRRGGAHILLAVAGFNFARFQLPVGDDHHPVGRMLRSIGRIAVPATCWIGALVLLTDDYSIPTALLVNDHLGSPTFDERWRYWFIEALVQILLVLAVAFAIPAVRRLERRRPFLLPFGLVLLALPLRYEVLAVLDVRHHTVQPQTTLWLFLLGWAAARSASVPQRLLVSAVAVLATPGFLFSDPKREALVAGGVLLLAWVPSIPVPRPLHRIIGPLAAASLYTYLTHWHVFPAVAERTTPLVAVLVSLAVGVAAWSLAMRLPRWRRARRSEDAVAV